MSAMTELGPLDHLLRPALPWRQHPHLTECGKELDRVDPARLITVAELQRRIRELGQKRAAYSTCITCSETAGRHRATDPVDVVMRELAALRWVRDRSQGQPWERRRLIATELEAVAALVAAHREEFDGYLADRAAAVSLADHRSSRRRPRAVPTMGGTL